MRMIHCEVWEQSAGERRVLASTAAKREERQSDRHAALFILNRAAEQLPAEPDNVVHLQQEIHRP